MTLRRSDVIRCAAIALAAPHALRGQAAEEPKRKTDRGDAAEGTYEGDVISYSQGSSQSGVTLTVRRIAKNIVRVTSDCPRLPAIEVPMTPAIGKLVQARGDSVFLLDRSRNHAKLDVSLRSEVSWSGFQC